MCELRSPPKGFDGTHFSPLAQEKGPLFFSSHLGRVEPRLARLGRRPRKALSKLNDCPLAAGFKTMR